MDPRIIDILKRVAEGVNCYDQTYHECALCYKAVPVKDSDHDEDCPVVVSKQILKDLGEDVPE